MNRRSGAAAAVVVGIVLILLAVLADTLGIGGQGGFGWKQAVLLGVGVVAILVGGSVLTGAINPRRAPDEGGTGEA